MKECYKWYEKLAYIEPTPVIPKPNRRLSSWNTGIVRYSSFFQDPVYPLAWQDGLWKFEICMKFKCRLLFLMFSVRSQVRFGTKFECSNWNFGLIWVVYLDKGLPCVVKSDLGLTWVVKYELRLNLGGPFESWVLRQIGQGTALSRQFEFWELHG